MDASPIQRILLLAPGRSGSTLLQSAFLASCGVLTFFEPCRHGPGGGSLHKKKCIPQALRFLDCKLPQKKERWNPPALRGWLRHPYNDANTSCPNRDPFAATVAEAKQACQSAAVVLVKEIRLVGQLSRIAAAHSRRHRRDANATAIVHLVRDPRPMLTSQRRLGWWNFGNLSGHKRDAEMERVSSRLCTGLAADAAEGERMKQAADGMRYIRVRFEELADDLPGTTARLYAALGLPLPRSTRDWLSRTMGGQCAYGDAADSRNATDRQRFEYSTCRRDRPSRRPRWKQELSSREKRTIHKHCAGVMRTLGYGHASAAQT